jgi:hypothetical protein
MKSLSYLKIGSRKRWQQQQQLTEKRAFEKEEREGMGRN